MYLSPNEKNAFGTRWRANNQQFHDRKAPIATKPRFDVTLNR